jgi:hypothetical protein
MYNRDTILSNQLEAINNNPYYIDRMSDPLPETIDAVINLFNKHKMYYIKDILKDIAAGNYHFARYKVNILNYVKINWPEIDVITRSLNSLP